MSEKLSAVVLHGASADRPDEADTIVQAETVAAALRRLGWDARITVLGRDLKALDRMLAPRPAFVFNLVEALGGDSRAAHLVPRTLDRLKIPYSGAGAKAQLLTTVKPLAKRILRENGLPTPDWIEDGFGSSSFRKGARLIVKAASEDASLGIDARSVVPLDRVRQEIASRSARFGGDWFAEAFIDGREFNVGLLEAGTGLEVLPIAEILFLDFPADRPRIVDYEAKWLEDSFAYQHTPRRFSFPAADLGLLKELRRLAGTTFQLFGLGGYGRVDFRVDHAGQPWILEVNANPCLSEDAGFVAAAQRAGLTVDDVVRRIVSAAEVEAARAVA